MIASQSNRTIGSRRAFTLVELVVVILIIGILSAVAVPKLFNTATKARESGTRQSLAVLRDAIELYRSQNEVYPTAASLKSDLTAFLKGPFPSCQVGANQNDTVVVSASNPLTVTAGGAGWVYNETTGDIAINDASYIAW